MYINPLILAARIWDADYPKDPNPDNWRTINGAKVHIGEGQQIDGGAGGKFTGKEFGTNFSAEEGFSGKYTAPKKFHKKAKSLEFKTKASEPEQVDESSNEAIDYYLAKMSDLDLAKITLEQAKKKLNTKGWTKGVVYEAYKQLNDMFTSGEIVDLGYEPDEAEAAQGWLDEFYGYFPGEKHLPKIVNVEQLNAELNAEYENGNLPELMVKLINESKAPGETINQQVVETAMEKLKKIVEAGDWVDFIDSQDMSMTMTKLGIWFGQYPHQMPDTPLQKAASVFTEASVKAYNADGKMYPFRKSNYTQAHQDNAVWCQTADESYKKFDAQSATVWANANTKEKAAIKEYTQSFHKFNEPLRGIEYGTGDYKGVGNIDFKNVGHTGYNNLKPGEVRNQIRAMTDYIERSAFDEDIWLQRGCAYGGMDKFLNLSKPLNQYSLEELKTEILGTKVTEHGFMSCGAAKNTGFSSNPVTFNIYAPAGTKMAYAANFSHYPDENEMILQRGTQFRVSKIEPNPKGGFFINLEVVGYNMQKV